MQMLLVEERKELSLRPDLNIESLRRKVIAEIESFNNGHVNNATKEAMREQHLRSRREILSRDQSWIRSKSPKLLPYFANGNELDPTKISPSLVEVETSTDNDLFRFARYTWSLPYTKGYGRRLRFLLFDSYHEKLMGILGLQSPPIDFVLRDKLFNYPSGRKVELVNQTMDAYVLGAVPPYSWLLGGKLVVLAASSKEIHDAYKRKYDNRPTQIENNILPSEIVMLTTTSAFGRSSLYNRVFFEKEGRRYKVAESLGFTKGYGVFHFSESLYKELRAFVSEVLPKRKVAGFGAGPKVKWQVITLALEHLKLPGREIMNHKIPREAYLIRLVQNLKAYMSGRDSIPHYYDWSFEELAGFWREHYLLNSQKNRPPDWKYWRRESIREDIFLEQMTE